MSGLRIAHIVVEVPWPPDKGGKISFYNHLRELSGYPGVTSSLVLLDEDGDRAGQAEHFRTLGLETAVFGRSLPRAGDSISAGMRALFYFLFSVRPRICRVRRSTAARGYMRDLLRQGLDAIVFEHISGWEMIPPEAVGRVPIVCVTHNVERRVALDQFRFQRTSSPLRVFFLGEYLKTVVYERRMMKRLTALISISESDAEWYRKAYPGTRTVLTDERIPERTAVWHGSPGGKRLLFVGSHRYFPNLDALRWLCRSLVPALRRIDPEIRLSICGISGAEAAGLGLLSEGVDFLGFLEDGELGRLHCECDLYVCPIRLGSGIKMKILDAVSYAMPVAAVPESLAGIRVDGPDPCLDFDDPVRSAGNVSRLLGSREALEEMSARTSAALGAYRRDRRCFGGAVMEAAGLKPAEGPDLCPRGPGGLSFEDREVR